MGDIILPSPTTGGMPAGTVLANLGPGQSAAQPVTIDQLAAAVAQTGQVASGGAPANLANSGVTAGSYTLANITVNAQGIVTAASSGSASGGGYLNQVMGSTPTGSGTGLTTWINQSTASRRDGLAGLCIYGPTAANQISCVSKAVPGATPYHIDAIIRSDEYTIGNAGFGAVFGWSDGTKIQCFMFTNGSSGHVLHVLSYTNFVSGGSASAINLNGLVTDNSPVCVSLTDDGTNAIFQLCPAGDYGNRLTLFSTAKASGFLGTNGYANIIFGANFGNGGQAATLLSYTQR